MSDDNEPQGPFDPFIRFKNHVNSRIGTGVSVLTGTTEDRDGSSPCPGRSQSPGGPKRQSGMAGAWDDWCKADPYSPHNLHHLPQPTPKDLPPGADPADFGFPEAFEDLMSASNPSRGHLMNLEMRAGLKRTASGGPAKPETPSAWVRRLYGDALLPPHFIWQQPMLAQPPRPFETPRGAEHDHDPTGEVVRAFLRTLHRIDSIADGSFSNLEELMGRDIAEMMRKAQTFAERAIDVLSGERSEDDDSSSSHVNSHGGPRPASVSEEDQPATEEDLYEMIQSASAEADKFLNNFMKARAGHIPPPAERPTRDTPPVSETVEHDPSGGRTIRTSSEHVDIFGFIHSKTEVRRLNAKGETVHYDTRYSVRSSADGPRPQEEYRPRSDAPVSVLMTPEQYSAFISKSSDEQLEAFRISTAMSDESALDPENRALRDRQMQLILQEQQQRAGRRAGDSNHALQDYQMQLMLLEQQNKKRLMMARQEERDQHISDEQLEQALAMAREAQGVNSSHQASDYHEQLRHLEEHNKKRLMMARQEQDLQEKMRLLEQQNKKRLMMARQEQDSGKREDPLQPYQGQLRLLEEQNKKRQMMARQEQDAAAKPPPEKPQGNTDSERSGWFWR